jgi:signal peptidase II
MSEHLLNAKDEGRYSLKGSRLWGILLFLILIWVDQVTKMLAAVYFSAPNAPQKVDIIPGWISLCLRYNDGIAYGIGGDASPALKIGVIAVTMVMMLGLTILYLKVDKRRSWLRNSLVLVVGGGIGNFIDRVYYRVWEPNCLFGVRDMVDLSRFGFAVCNFADFFICIGAALMVVSLFFFDTDAIFPLTKKYKALAKEAQEKAEAKKQEKNG